MPEPEEDMTREELEEKRTPEELLSWAERKMNELSGKALRLKEDPLVKKFAEEVYPLAIFAMLRFDKREDILLKPVVGSQSYDATVTDLSSSPSSQSYIEITQAHEGETEYLRNLFLEEHGYGFGTSKVTKKGTKKTGMEVTIEPQVTTPGQTVACELLEVFRAAKRKKDKDCPPNTALVIMLDDGGLFRRADDIDTTIDRFVEEHIVKLELPYCALYLVGWRKGTFRQYSLA